MWRMCELIYSCLALKKTYRLREISNQYKFRSFLVSTLQPMICSAFLSVPRLSTVIESAKIHIKFSDMILQPISQLVLDCLYYGRCKSTAFKFLENFVKS